MLFGAGCRLQLLMPFFLCTCWLNYLILWQKLVSLYMYVTWIDMRVVRSAALTLYSFCFDAQLVYQHPIKVIKLIKLLHSCLFLFATFDTLFYYLPFVSTICVCASSWVCVCIGVSVCQYLLGYIIGLAFRICSFTMSLSLCRCFLRFSS